jgi:hypothetical protein
VRQRQGLDLHFDEAKWMRQKVTLRWRERDRASDAVAVLVGLVQSHRRIFATSPEHRCVFHGFNRRDAAERAQPKARIAL